MIVWLASYPRSGNRFVRTLLQDSFDSGATGNIYSPEDEGPPDARLSDINFVENPDQFEKVRRSESIVFVKTHALADPEDDSPALYLVRDGRDAVVSYARFAISGAAPGFEDRTPEEATETLIEQEDPDMGGWSTNVRSWTRRAAPTSIIRFEELIVNPLDTLGRASASLGLPLGDPVKPPPTFEQLRSSSPDLYSRGKVGGWRSEMSARLEQLFWKTHGAEMLVMGYPREPTWPASGVAP